MGAHYFICWFRWQQQDWYTSWMTQGDLDALCPDIHRKVPLFSTIAQLQATTRRLGWQLETEEPSMIDLDAAAAWMTHPLKQVPKECLSVWNIFSDLATGTGHDFAGDRRAPVRERVFDLLYQDHGPDWEGAPWRPEKGREWRLAERKKLIQVLRRGFKLWQRSTYLAAPGELPLLAPAGRRQERKPA